MRILFIHGGGDGAYAFDRDMASGLRDALRDMPPIEYPHIDGLERIEWERAHSQLAEVLHDSPERTIVIAHSIGGTAVLKLFTLDACDHVANAFLLAPPYKAADSHWGVDDFTFPNDFATHLSPEIGIAIYHSQDDAIIPVGDAIAYHEKLPDAKLLLLKQGGHQFAGGLAAIADDIRSAVRAAS